MLKKPIKNFSFRFPGTVWNMLLDYQKFNLVVEVRNVSLHKTKFFVINLKTGTALIKELEFEEPWWIGMADVDGGVILFHLHESDQNPKPTAYFLYDIKTRKKIWESSDYMFLHKTSLGFLFSKEIDDNVEYFVFDPKSGKGKNMPEIPLNSKNSSTVLKRDENNVITYPFHYPEGSDYFNAVRDYLIQFHLIKPEKAIEYLEYKDTINISYYLYSHMASNGTLLFDNFLLILDKQGHQIFNEKIDENLSGIGLDTFFIVHDQLIFSKFKSEIVSYFIK